MVLSRRFVAAVLVLAGASTAILASQAQWPRGPENFQEQAAVAEFARRTQAYADLHRSIARVGPPLVVSADPAEIRRAMDALALGIQRARAGARQGDIFSPEITLAFRRLVGAGCHEQFLELLAQVNEELERPLPTPIVNARWPESALLPTMNPEMLAALPQLPAELEYRFVNRDLVLRDIDADLIVDFITNAIPATSSLP